MLIDNLASDRSIRFMTLWKGVLEVTLSSGTRVEQGSDGHVVEVGRGGRLEEIQNLKPDRYSP